MLSFLNNIQGMMSKKRKRRLYDAFGWFRWHHYDAVIELHFKKWYYTHNYMDELVLLLESSEPPDPRTRGNSISNLIR